MIKYPNGTRKTRPKTTPKSMVNYADRGMNFESEIDQSNEYYRKVNRALIYKKPTPIKVVKASKNETGSYQINEAYFMQPSTTDYNGIYREKYIDFEAKETKNSNLFPLSNIHKHQLEHLFAVQRHGGIAFILVRFVKHNEVYLLDASFLEKAISQNLKSLRYEFFKEKALLVPFGYQVPIDYLRVVDDYYFQ